MARAFGLIGAPSSAGAYSPGQEDAPAALRAAGLAARLEAAGATVVDLGDTPRFRWRPDHDAPRAMHAGAVRATALAVADLVEDALARDLLPLVLGGDCTVELGTIAGWQRSRPATTLVYVDPHPDLNVPSSVPDGAFDWMGLAHLLGEPGAVDSLVDLGTRVPALTPSDVLVVGYAPDRASAHERAAVERLDLRTIDQAAVAADPAAAAARTLAFVEPRGPFLVHLDADSVDFADLPLAENTDRNVGLTFDQVAGALDRILASPALGAITITEVNPHHGDAGGATLETFLDRLVPALAATA